MMRLYNAREFLVRIVVRIYNSRWWGLSFAEHKLIFSHMSSQKSPDYNRIKAYPYYTYLYF